MCEYCKNDGVDVNYLMMILSENDCGATLRINKHDLDLFIMDKDMKYKTKSRQINYCPMCGRKLSSTVDHDYINHPAHYTTGRYEVIDVIEDWDLNYNLGNALKYIGRAEHKGTTEDDLKKAIWYLQRDVDNRMQEKQPDLFENLPF